MHLNLAAAVDSDAPRIYLDNAATSWPKQSDAVRKAIEYINDCGATAGRGTYSSSQIADRWVQDARRSIARLINAPKATDIALCSSGTHALNAALAGLLRGGDHVITTSAEHNSVLRPLEMLRSQIGIEFDVVQADPDGRTSAEHARALVRPTTRAICIGQASNVTGGVVDLQPWRELADATKSLLVVDASQTLGYIPIDVGSARIDILAAAAHKGLRAFHGTGILFVQQASQSALRPLMSGGTGHKSELIDGGHEWPNSIEPGNLNMPGVVSIAVAATTLNETPARLLDWHESYLRLAQGLAATEGVTIVGVCNEDLAGSLAEHRRIPVISVRLDGWSPHDVASILNDFHGIEARAGLHCAALVHDSVGTMKDGGTLRLSPGHSTTPEEIDQTVAAVKAILSSGT
ncbi:MAG: aminotransferase class V-fold PLP-dependent enzyme [Aureliella sp.]